MSKPGRCHARLPDADAGADAPSSPDLHAPAARTDAPVA